MFPADLVNEAQRIIGLMRSRSLRLATAESCTGGLLSGLITEVAGSSDIFDRGFVSYSNSAKIGLLGVDLELLLRHGAVSREAALAMADGALRASAADIALSVTGIAGPGGGTPEKPVGLVFIAIARRGAATRVIECRFGDRGRSEVRLATLEEALRLLGQDLERHGSPGAPAR